MMNGLKCQESLPQGLGGDLEGVSCNENDGVQER